MCAAGTLTARPAAPLWWALVVLLVLAGCKGLEAGAASGGCLSGEAAGSNAPPASARAGSTGTLAAPKGLTHFEFSAPPNTNFALCVW
jgi:hypothetical protein